MPRRVTDRPTEHMFQTALNVLLWLHIEVEGDGEFRDQISRVRDAIYTEQTRPTSPGDSA